MQPGDHVAMGQALSDSPERVFAPVHASVAGRVVGVAQRPHPMGGTAASVVIRAEGQDEWVPSVIQGAGDDPKSLSVQEMVARIREAGVVGMGGAAFPTAAKLVPPPGRKVDTLIINGTEGEPYLSVDCRLMIECTEEVLDGIAILSRILNTERAFLVIEHDKPEAVEAVQGLIRRNGLERSVSVVTIDSMYVYGAEKLLVRTLLRREIPAGGLPADVGVLSQNVGTTIYVSRAVRFRRPVTERVVTVAGGAVGEPRNLHVRIGTPFEQLVLACGGLRQEPSRIVMGGPMMGRAQVGLDVPVIKGTSAILCLTEQEVQQGSAQACIHCARCVDVCPVGLLPFYLADCSEKGDRENAEIYCASACLECGVCSYVCPAYRDLVQLIRASKREIVRRREAS